MPKFSKWFRGRSSGIHESKHRPKAWEPDLPSGLPVLSPKRRHALTPSTSHEDLSHNGVARSSFFERLPLELRHRIYAAAFGDRIIHMDLRFDYPELPGTFHARLNAEVRGPRDHTVPPGWIWWSSVCHRHPALDACYDKCRTGALNTTCSLYPGEMPDKCFLGVIRWLLTCRQA